MYDVITWFNQPDGRVKLYLTTRDRLKAEKAVHTFAELVDADVVELKPDKNGLYEATLRERVKRLPENFEDLAKACKAPAKHKRMRKWKAPSIIQLEGEAHQTDDNLAGGE